MSDCRMSHTRRFLRFLFAAALSLAATHHSEATSPAAPLSDLEDRLAPDHPDMRTIVSPDWAELVPPSDVAQETRPKSFAVITPSAQQPQGVLSGKIVFMNSGHGWTHDPAFSPPWRLQRGVGNQMNEDYGNLDQLNFFAAYCFNAGATVVSMRPLGHQTNEVILDNDDAAVTFSGSWSTSTSTIFWGSPGDVPYRFASFAATETATATYTPTIPVAGYYPVYCWTRNGSDRGFQLYRVRHTGGESQVRIPHQMVGNGWVYLGEYYFNAGANAAIGSVVISNLRGTPDGSVIIADAIRFGNGMGSVDQGGGVSGYPREDENMRYWVKANLAQGQSTSLYEGSGDDESDSWSAPPKMSAEMNREGTGDIYDRIHISFHSNAGGGRGTVGLITGDPTPNEAQLAQIAGQEVNDDLVALGSPPLEAAWFNRTTHTYTGGYSEIDGSLFNYEMAATIIEVAFHDDPTDAMLMCDAKARAAVGKAAMHAMIKFMHQFDTNDTPALSFLPEAPTNFRAIAGTNGQIALAWTAPVNLGGSQNPTNYVIYRSTNGYGFGNPVSVGNVTSYTITNLPANTDFYFRVSAANAGGESMPSEVVGCRASSSNPDASGRVLVVNGFDRFDRTTNLRHDVARQSWDPPGNSGAIERVFPRWINGFDYVVQHGKAIANYGLAFDSCQNEAILNNQVFLTNYPIVIWACGNETVGSETFSSAEQTKIAAFLAANGNLFVSGADVANDLDRASGPTAADRTFLHNQLHAAFTNDNSTSYTGTSVASGIFAGRANVTVDNGSKGIYWVQTPDVLGPFGAGAVVAMNYSGGTGGAAAIQYDGLAGGGRTVLMGFPFETITSAARRNEYMTDVLNFLGAAPATNIAPTILTPPQSQIIAQGSNTTLTVIASGTAPLTYQWRFNGVDLGSATQSSLARNNCQPTNSGNYDVIVSNAFGVATSQVALLQVMLPSLQTLFLDNFDVNTAANWVTNRSSTDTRVTFNYNYAANGIPSAPNSTNGTTRGVKFEANMTAGVAAAINISPVQSFGGDYRLHFDMWINQNGPFLAGGTGSTQHGTAGVGTAGNRVQWTGAGSTADGFWFAVDGEGQASDTSTTALNDFGAFTGTTYHAAASGVYAAGTASDVRGNNHAYYASTFPGGQTAPASQLQSGALAVGTMGFAWRDVIISKTGSTVEWFINGLKIATITGASFTSSNIFLGCWDYFISISDNTNLSFGLFDNLRVERFVTNVPPYITTQPQSLTVTQNNSATFNVTAGGTVALAYQWRFNGTNLAGATGSSFTRNNVQPIDAGDYSVLITNVAGMVTSSNALLTVILPQPLKFESAALLSANQLKLVISGEPGTVTIQWSTNLTDWETLTNLANPTGMIEFTDTIPAEATQRYYRARMP